MAAPVEQKVTATTAVTGAFSLLAAVLTWVQGSPQALDFLPAWASGVVILVIPTVLTFVAGYLAKHQDRSEPADPALRVAPAPAPAAEETLDEVVRDASTAVPNPPPSA